MKQVLRTPNAAEAHVAVAALENAGIEAVIQDEFMGALPVAPNAYPSVWVRDEDYAEACEVLGVRRAEPVQTDRSPLKPLLWIIAAMMLGIIITRILQAAGAHPAVSNGEIGRTNPIASHSA
ncbi:MAG: putative signal transducing protein [Gemmatimonadaceae bacterium]